MMKELNVVNGTMSTKDFEALTGTTLNHVHVKTKKLLVDLGFNIDDLNLDHNEFQLVRDNRGYISEIKLNKDLALTLAGQYEPKIAYHVAKAFNATPATAPNVVVSKSPLELLNEATALANSYHEEMQVAKTKLLQIGEHLAGSVISELGENTTFNMAAKVFSSNLKIKLGHNQLMAMLRDNKWLMTGERSFSERNIPTQQKMHFFMIKLFQNDTTGKVTCTPVITPKGMVALARLIPSWIPVNMKSKQSKIPVEAKEVVVPQPPEVSNDKLQMVSEPKDVELWYANGWTDELLIAHEHALPF